MNDHLRGCLLIIASMFFFSFIGPIVRWINLPTPVIMFLYSLFVVVLLAIYARVKGISLKLKDPWVIYSSIALGLNSLGYLKAYALTTLANSVLSHYTAPIFALFFSVVLLKERLEKLSIFAAILSFAGLLIISYPELSFGNSHLAGILWGTFSGLAYGVLITINKKIVSDNNITKVLFYQGLVPMIFVLPFMFTIKYTLTYDAVLLSLLYSIIAFIVPGILYLSGLRYVKAQHAGIVAYSEPVFVLIFGIVLFSEMPTIRTLIGGVIILFSGYLIIRAESKRKQKH